MAGNHCRGEDKPQQGKNMRNVKNIYIGIVRLACLRFPFRGVDQIIILICNISITSSSKEGSIIVMKKQHFSNNQHFFLFARKMLASNHRFVIFNEKIK